MDSAAAFPPSATAGAAMPASGSLAGDLVKAKDLSHHLSELAKARRFSPLKTFSKYMGRTGIISLAGGLPDPSYFPFDTLGGNLLAIDTYATEEGGSSSSSQSSSSWLASWFTGSSNSGSGSKVKTQQIAVPKFARAPLPDTLQLSQALQYGGAQGLLFLQNFLKEWTTILSPPLYEDWDVLVDDGATDGWHKVLELLCNPGDPILVEAWTYPSAVESGWPMGVRPVPCPIDADGLVPDTFEKTLREWDEQARGCKRPRVLYTVPVGQNPCGSVADVKRKQQIYDICVKYDVILCEDDPYYILQFPWEKEDPSKKNPHLSLKEENRQFLRSLSPSYLTIDYEGRVIRLDTFSKTVAPGSRLGWITSNAKFSERLLRASETSTQQPSGFAQVLVCKMIETWGMEGWIRWLRGLRSEYRERRDVTVDALHKEFKIETVRKRALPGYEPAAPSQSVKMVGYAKYNSARRTPVNTVDLEEKFSNFGLQEGRKALISFSPPEGGMFVWINVHLAHHPKFKRDASPAERVKQTKDLMNSLWEKLADNNVLIAPGWMFAGDGLRVGAPDDEPKGPPSLLQQTEEEFRVMVEDAEQGIGHFRLAFSYSTHETLRKGIKIFAETVVDFFDESA